LRMGQVLDALNEALGPHLFPDKADGSDPRACPTCGDGRLSLKAGRYGAFIGCSNYPECRFTRPIGVAGDEEGGASGDRELGIDPTSGNAIWLKAGRFGPYVEELATPPKRASLPKDWPPSSVDLDRALRLLRLPRDVGIHPDAGGMIVAGIGRYGPYVQHNGVYASLAGGDEVFDVGLNRAVAVLAEKAAGGGRKGRASGALRELGAHPATGEPVRLMSGRYGPYVKHGETNANLPRGADPESLTLDEAVALVAAREGVAPKRKARSAASRAASKTAKPRAAKPKAKAKPKARK